LLFWSRPDYLAARLYLGIAQGKEPAGQGQAPTALVGAYVAATHGAEVEPAGNHPDLADSAAAAPATDRDAPLPLAFHGAQQRFARPHFKHFSTDPLEDPMQPIHGRRLPRARSTV